MTNKKSVFFSMFEYIISDILIWVGISINRPPCTFNNINFTTIENLLQEIF